MNEIINELKIFKSDRCSDVLRISNMLEQHKFKYVRSFMQRKKRRSLSST